MPAEDGAFLARSLVQQLVVVLDEVGVRVDLPREPQGHALPDVVSEGRVVFVREHGVDDSPVLEGRAERLRHVRKVIRHFSLQARHAVVHDVVEVRFDRADFVLGEHVFQDDEAAVAEGRRLGRGHVDDVAAARAPKREAAHRGQQTRTHGDASKGNTRARVRPSNAQANALCCHWQVLFLSLAVGLRRRVLTGRSAARSREIDQI
mmetsp:Transcript_32262/g.108663  ORF Transcript_32262/g.108663 Transcript_32262/m.108663 type:complete len:206 (-) Transcript_32262:13-630(-)